MKRVFRTAVFILLVVVVIILISTFRSKSDKAAKMDSLLDQMSLNKMEQDVQSQIAIHKKYLDLLQGLNSQIKALGDRLEHKVKIAHGMGEIGDAYAKANLLPIALEFYRMGLEIFPQDIGLNYRMGVTLANIGAYDSDKTHQYFKEARALYRKVLALDADYSDSHYSLALLYLVASDKGISIGSLSSAMSEIQAYLNANTSNVRGYFLKARVAYAQKDDATAIESYQTILNLSSVGSADYSQAKKNLAQLLG